MLYNEHYEIKIDNYKTAEELTLLTKKTRYECSSKNVEQSVISSSRWIQEEKLMGSVS